MFQISIKGWSLARTAGLGWCHLLELDIAAHGCSVPIQVKWRDMAIMSVDRPLRMPSIGACRPAGRCTPANEWHDPTLAETWAHSPYRKPANQ